MREIKFRGKRVDNDEWVYGYYFIDERDIEDEIIWRDIPQIQQRYGDHFNYFDVDPKTVGQYTGLKDKNGKEIYEGDIVAITNVSVRDMADPDPFRRIIKYDNERGGFAQYRINGEEGGSGWSFCQEVLNHYYELVGNIYEAEKEPTA